MRINTKFKINLLIVNYLKVRALYKTVYMIQINHK